VDIPKDWTFKNKAVADEFDFHVRQQLPWYDLATGLVAHLVRHYLPQNGIIYDIGCSTGNLEIALGDLPQKRNARFIPIDNSPEMVDLYQGKYNVIIDDAQNITYEHFDVAVCFLCLMFLSVEDRKRLTEKLRDNVKRGGCVIIVDKTEMAAGYLATVLHRATIAGKVASGAPSDEIVAKELSLAGIQRPLPNGYIERRFFTPIEIFRFGEFAGWIYTRDEW
jgi:tRNA (cmo5U34)-methyltransferase